MIIGVVDKLSGSCLRSYVQYVCLSIYPLALP